VAGWEFVKGNALQLWDLPSLLVADWPQLSFNENRGYVGVLAFLLAIIGFLFPLLKQHTITTEPTTSACENSHDSLRYAFVVFVFALLFALATPLAQSFYFGVPGLSQMGGVGRALILWNLGVALAAAFGLDALRTKLEGKAQWLAPVVVTLVGAQLFSANWNSTPTAPRAAIYPATLTTTFLQNATRNGGRVLFLTPRRGWFASEDLPEGARRTHPAGVLLPNGATAYDLNDVNGYDSLSSGAYRQWLIENEKADVSPPRNGNIVMLNNLDSPALDALDVRYVVSLEQLARPDLREVSRGEGVVIYERRVLDVSRKSGRDFFPGWQDDVYQPQSFRVGAWLSLVGLMLASFVFGARIARPRVAD
jgi:hypothetical protein